MKIARVIGEWIGGGFLGEERMLKFLPFGVFLTGLALLSIKCSHSADLKAVQIGRLTQTMKELEAEHIETKSRLMQLEMESHVIKKAVEMGFQESTEPPKKIIQK